MYPIPEWREEWTIYIRHVQSATGLFKPIRRVLTNVKSRNQQETTTIRTGVVMPVGGMTLMVFNQDDITYIPYHEWLALSEHELDNYWSIQSGTNTNSIIVDHVVDHEFTYTNNSNSELMFLNPATGVVGARRIIGFEDHRRGSTVRSQHILIRA